MDIGEKLRMSDWKEYIRIKRQKDSELLHLIKENMDFLEELLRKVNFAYEDRIYRFYHRSFKVYWLQELTMDIFHALEVINPRHFGEKLPEPFKDHPIGTMDKDFLQIIADGTPMREFELADNENFAEITRPFMEAFLHARYFLEMAVKYGKELEEAPQMLPSGWAALLELYNIR